MKTLKQQQGMIEVEGWENVGKAKDQPASSKPETVRASQDNDVGGRDQEVKQNSRHAVGWRGLILAIAVALLLLWVAYMFRFEVIPIASPVNGLTQYIVKDRWTGEIETVWQTPDGKVRRSSRQAFE